MQVDYGRWAGLRSILLWGAGIWLGSVLVGGIAALYFNRPAWDMILTASDLAVVMLILPWFVSSVLFQTARSTTARGAMQRLVEGGAYEASQRDFHQAMRGTQWVGSFEERTALMAVVVLLLDLGTRLVIGYGWTPLPWITT